MLKLRAEGRTDVGRTRGNNEDSYLVMSFRLASEKGDLRLALAAVCDGVGGLEAGEVASRVALLSYSAGLLDCVSRLAIEGKLSDGGVAGCIRDAVNRANDAVKSRVVSGGTTLVSALVILDSDSATAYVANVGDSRAYLLSGDEIYQVTQDHSPAWEDFLREAARLAESCSGEELAKRYSKLKHEAITRHPRAHVISDVVGYYARVDTVDVHRLRLRCGDALLLASDGLTDALEDAEILRVVGENRKKGLRRTLDALVGEAKERGGEDNITVVLMLVDCGEK